MKLKTAFFSALILGCSSPLMAQSDAQSLSHQESAVSFTSEAGQTVEAFEGSFSVPENRSDPVSRTLTLRYIRFPAVGDNSAPPIVYLAGGPGGSGIETAKGRRFDLFMAMREFGDVIAFDQRGTGASNDLPNCVSSQTLAATSVITDETYVATQEAALRECLGFWSEEGVDVRGYNTLESVADLEALRVHLGSEKLTLWGISYGSHLALAAVKEMEDRIARVVIASAEGLDQTIKLPARTDEYFERVQQAINTQPKTREAYPDIIAMMRRVHDQLDREPIMLSVPQRDGTMKDYLWQRRDMQQAASGAISDPVPLSLLMQIYAGLDSGDTSILNAVAPYFVSGSDQVSMRPMSVLMDIASGTDSNRRALIQTQARTSLLGPFLNQPVELEDVDPSLVLGPDFRTNPVSTVPLLLLSGTLDGRTYLESQREAVAGFSNAQVVTIHNVGHNLFMASPEVTDTIQEFMRDINVDGREIDFPLTDLLTAGFSMLR